MKIRLKYWRERRGLSIRDLAELSSASSATIVAVEKTGDAPRPAVLKKLTKALNVTMEELIDDRAEGTLPAMPGSDPGEHSS